MDEAISPEHEPIGAAPELDGDGLFQSARHMTDTVADFFVNEGAGTPAQVYAWFEALAAAEGKRLNTSLRDVRAACEVLAKELSLCEPPLLAQTLPGVYALQNVNAW